jgi:hypothetical protein
MLVVLAIGQLIIGQRQLMKTRNVISFNEYEEDVILTIKTLCPEKWLLIDRETGQTYVGNPGGYWDRLDAVKKVDKK